MIYSPTRNQLENHSASTLSKLALLISSNSYRLWFFIKRISLFEVLFALNTFMEMAIMKVYYSRKMIRNRIALFAVIYWSLDYISESGGYNFFLFSLDITEAGFALIGFRAIRKSDINPATYFRFIKKRISFIKQKPC